jgi:hypothetical protein
MDEGGARRGPSGGRSQRQIRSIREDLLRRDELDHDYH